jgi:hypothetical protein
VEAKRALEFLYEDVLGRLWPRNQHRASQPPGATRGMQLNGQQPRGKLLDRMRNALRVGQYALDTEKTQVDWGERLARLQVLAGLLIPERDRSCRHA